MAFRENPVINSPFEAPAQHYVLDRDGQATPVRETGRRASIQIVPVVSVRRGAKQDELDLGDAAQEKPSTGRVCVKVINHFGDEVQRVFQVS